jgi:outer membrane protein OmpA-like peptidoglycan-associated protein
VRRRGRLASRAAAAAGAVALALAGCASRPPSIADARAAYEEASADPDIRWHAPVALYEAEKAVRRAEESWERESDATAADHLAFIARKRVEIARAKAEGRRAELDAESLSQRRDEALMRARTLEASRERQRADALERELRDLQAQRTARGVVITLGDVLFDFGAAELKPDARRDLVRLAGFLRQHPDREVAIEGHTDSFGPDAINLELSQRRAESVASFLAEAGVESYRLVARGLGEAFPLVSNSSPAGRQRNRRVEIVILEPGQSASEAVRTPL